MVLITKIVKSNSTSLERHIDLINRELDSRRLPQVSKRQLNEIDRALRENLIRLAKDVEHDTHISFMHRIGIIPLILITCFCYAIVCPIKWIVTGSYYFNRNSRMGMLLENWLKRYEKKGNNNR